MGQTETARIDFVVTSGEESDATVDQLMIKLKLVFYELRIYVKNMCEEYV